MLTDTVSWPAGSYLCPLVAIVIQCWPLFSTARTLCAHLPLSVLACYNLNTFTRMRRLMVRPKTWKSWLHLSWTSINQSFPFLSTVKHQYLESQKCEISNYNALIDWKELTKYPKSTRLMSGSIWSVNKTRYNRFCSSSMENILLTLTHLIYNR